MNSFFYDIKNGFKFHYGYDGFILSLFYIFCILMILFSLYNIVYISLDTFNLSTLHNTGTIIHQEFKPQHNIKHIEIAGKTVVGITNEIPNQWILYISINNLSFVPAFVNKEFYNTIKQGDKIAVSYTKSRLTDMITIVDVKNGQ